MERDAPRVQVGETRCPFCHDPIARGEEPVACPACHGAHHEACLREHGRCAACGADHPRLALARADQGRRERVGLLLRPEALIAQVGLVTAFAVAMLDSGGHGRWRGMVVFVATLVVLALGRVVPTRLRNGWAVSAAFLILLGAGHVVGAEVLTFAKLASSQSFAWEGYQAIGLGLVLLLPALRKGAAPQVTTTCEACARDVVLPATGRCPLCGAPQGESGAPAPAKAKPGKADEPPPAGA